MIGFQISQYVGQIVPAEQRPKQVSGLVFSVLIRSLLRFYRSASAEKLGGVDVLLYHFVLSGGVLQRCNPKEAAVK